MWNWLVYAALTVGALATLSGLALLAVRLLQAWRSFKRLRRHVARELDRLADLGDATVTKLERATDTDELDRSLTSLRVSLARMAALREAFADATSFTAFIPRK